MRGGIIVKVVHRDLRGWICLIAMLMLLVSPSIRAETPVAADIGKTRLDDSILATISTRQTSADYLYEYMVARYNGSWQGIENRETERQRLALVTDVYIKAWSYAWMNKIFFLTSIILAFAVLLWPSVSAVAPKTLGEKPIFKSAVVQTTITALAAASFFVYSDYKDKQQSSENLMRYVIHSSDPMNTISLKVMEEFARIDKGFSFSTIVPGSGEVK